MSGRSGRLVEQRLLGLGQLGLLLGLVLVGLADLGERAGALGLVLGPPRVRFAGRAIHGALDVAVVRRPLATRPAAAPHVLARVVDLVVEAVIDGDVRVGERVDATHVRLELVAVLAAVLEVARQVQVGVYHLVEQRLHEVVARPILEQRLAQPDDAALAQVEDARAYRHPFAPLDQTRAQRAPEVLIVELLEHGANVRRRVDELPVRIHQIGATRRALLS